MKGRRGRIFVSKYKYLSAHDVDLRTKGKSQKFSMSHPIIISTSSIDVSSEDDVPPPKRGGCCSASGASEPGGLVKSNLKKGAQAAYDVAAGAGMKARENWHKVTHYVQRHMFEQIEANVEDAIIANLPTVANEVTKFILEAPFGNRQLGFACGVMLLVCGLINFGNNFLTLDVDAVVVDLVLVLIGIISLMTEYKVHLMPTRVAKYLHEDWRFLFKPYGRPCVYMFGAVFIISQSELLEWPLHPLNLLHFENFLVGVVVSILSLVIMYHTYIGRHDLAALRSKRFDYETLSKSFNVSDTNRNGTLSTAEFVKFLRNVGMELSHDDLETALLELDENCDGEIGWTEFVNWHERKEEFFV